MPNRLYEEILTKLNRLIKKNNSAKKALLLGEFARHYFALVSPDDLAERNIDELYNAVQSHWDFIYERKPGECKVRVFNPHPEDMAGHLSHTVVQIGHDDMPFLVDSVRMEINRQGFFVHYIVHLGGIRLKRNKRGEITAILPRHEDVPGSVIDAPILVEMDRQVDPQVLKELEKHLVRVLGDVSSAVKDWDAMLHRLDESLNLLEVSPPAIDKAEIMESKAFLHWMKDHFILFGCRDHEIKTIKKEKVYVAVPDTSLGVLRDNEGRHLRYLSDMSPAARKQVLSPHILNIAKTSTESTIHRGGYTDCIGVKMFNENGVITGERRFIGLYTSAAYNSSPRTIPFLRLKVMTVLQKTGFSSTSHAGKNVLNILETLPRDDLFQASIDELYELALGIFHLQERQRIRLFARKDTYGRFYSCLVYMPRESFNTDLIHEMQDIFRQEFEAQEISYSVLFTDSILARVHFIARINPDQNLNVDLASVEHQLIEVGMSWRQELQQALVKHFGEVQGLIYYAEYKNAFLASYREAYSAKTAVYDIEHIIGLGDDQPLMMNFYQPLHREAGVFRFKVYQRSSSIPLSDALPILENLGFRVIGENPHKVVFKNKQPIWINDFDLMLMRSGDVDLDPIKELFQEAFAAVWLGQAENDEFNRLIINAGIHWREAAMLRAYARYFQQIGFTFSQAYIAEALANNAETTKIMVELFRGRFDPSKKPDLNKLTVLEEKILQDLESISNIDEDRIFRHYLAVMKATLRTNYYQLDRDGGVKSYLAFKLNPQAIPEIPLPIPMFEIFVYSPRFEGVHLRGAKVSRGGLRWSDRREDFRTEVLGLMKAQQVKNAVIVPLGAKGGFVPKRLPVDGAREAVQEEAIACYQSFIRGLLDVTDNIVDHEVVPPLDVVRYDEDDPYLVVAADKGTATFSDTANAISMDYGFWLGDAFASGGSAGYDHKKMGITARGAWESVKRHFREMSVDVQTTPFTVVGIGDMAGDVFGNGMLQSKCIKLIAAFNHAHIFLDPDPDALLSYKERSRLFHLPRSTWEDYNLDLISKGGGVFKRSQKSIKLTPEVRRVLQVKRETMNPTELINAILKMEVDLLWNGGIGTYVKASSETNLAVGDRANDSLRVNANELQCKVIGEGGNLGLTQLARIEYSLQGGRCFTDFIDNSAGVDCSDHEVNIKILLNTVMSAGKLSLKKRNDLLSAMTDEVAKLVLQDNYDQTLAVSMATEHSPANMDLYSAYIDNYVRSGKLNRELEFLPDEKTIAERKVLGKGLTRPEMAVLFSYGKIRLKEQLLEGDLINVPCFSSKIKDEFPIVLAKKYDHEMQEHSLRREIIATQLANHLINQMGVTFIERVREETNAEVSDIVRTYFTVEEIFNKAVIWSQIEATDGKVEVAVQFSMMKRLNSLIRRATRWFLRNYPSGVKVDHFKKSVSFLHDHLFDFVDEENKLKAESVLNELLDSGVPKSLAEDIALGPLLLSALDIIEAAHESKKTIDVVAAAYFILGKELSLGWVREKVVDYPITDRWEALLRSVVRGDLDYIQRNLLVSFLKTKGKTLEEKYQLWASQSSYYLSRWDKRMVEIRTTDHPSLTMFTVAVRDLMELVQTINCDQGEK